jgi:hypothetical protein
MRNRLRILGLVAVFVLFSFATGNAWPPDYGTCYLYCEEGGYYQVDFVTQQECCFGEHYCPNSFAPMWKYWNTYGEGGPQLCG